MLNIGIGEGLIFHSLIHEFGVVFLFILILLFVLAGWYTMKIYNSIKIKIKSIFKRGK